mmetsp:Transcript_92900/g.200872  ORF Transcript_92900/g.200872 Transcript_92900/m.200872 type:complete len:115 (+) Transcript_92900:15-359(+)
MPRSDASCTTRAEGVGAGPCDAVQGHEHEALEPLRHGPRGRSEGEAQGPSLPGSGGGEAERDRGGGHRPATAVFDGRFPAPAASSRASAAAAAVARRSSSGGGTSKTRGGCTGL